MKEIAGTIAIIFTLILLLLSEEFRDIVEIGLLIYIAYTLCEIWKILK